MIRLVASCLVIAACHGAATTRDDAGAAPHDTAQLARAPADAAAAPKPARVEHAAWKLVDNRHAAHRAVDGEVVLDARDLGFLRYTRFGLPVMRWRLGQTVDGERAALADALASLEVPLSASQAAATQITARVYGGVKKQVLDVKVNGRTGGRRAQVVLEPGWQTVALPIEPGRFVVGENELAFETVTRGGKPSDRVAFAWIRIGTSHPKGDADPLAAATFDAKADAIELASGAELAWYVTVPDGANLVADVAAPCRVEVSARTSEATAAGGLLGGDSSRVDLSAVAGRVVRLSLAARDCPRARVVHARVTLVGPEPKPLPSADPPRFVVVWVMDALRADKVPVFTPGARAPTPNLVELAKSSAVFRQFYAPGDESQVQLLAKELARAGYYSVVVTAKGKANTIIPGDAVVDAALAQLEKHRDGPMYLFIGTSDETRACPASPPPAAELERLTASYDAAVTATDVQVGRLVQRLQSWGIWDQTLLVVTADHGEELFEDGRCGGSGSLRESLWRVPLLVHDPGRFPGGTVVDEGADAIDLTPTVLAALGRPGPDDGEPLESLAQGLDRGWARPSFAAMASGAYALRVGRWKLRVGGNGVPVIGDLAADPGETHDYAAARPVERRMLTDQLGLLLPLRAHWKKAAWGVTTNMTAEGAAALDDASTP